MAGLYLADSARLQGLHDVAHCVEAAYRVVKAWDDCSKAVDEFGKDSATYGEREDLLDSAILELKGFFSNDTGGM